MIGLVWWDVPIILTFRRLKQEDFTFETILGYIASLRSAKATYKDLVSENPKTNKITFNAF